MPLKSFIKDGVPTLKIQSEHELQGLRLIDVRRADEFDGELGHLNGATLKTLGADLENFLKSDNLEKDVPTLFICRSGVRSVTATKLAMELGFKQVFNMEGGMLFWNSLKNA
jgi:rhodanese-related sulfurtransferase